MMINLRDLEKIVVIPIKFDEERIDIPTWLRDYQYLLTYEEKETPLIDRVLINFDKVLKYFGQS